MRLNQIVAVLKGVVSKTEELISSINRVFAKPDLFEGISRTYHPRTEDGEPLNPETKLVQHTVSGLIQQLRPQFTEFLDLNAKRDAANNIAKSDVVVSNKILLKDVPVTTLMFLEKQITEIKGLVAAAPTLDPAEAWTLDEQAMLNRSAIRTTSRTAKKQKPIVLYIATDKHPAQTQLITEDELVGNWEAQRSSGAISKKEQRDFVKRCEDLLNAIKMAREDANEVIVPDSINVAEKVVDFIFDKKI